MSELIINEIKVGKKVLIFLKNGFRYEGKVLDLDKQFVKLFDFKSNSNKIISIDSIESIGGCRDD